MVSSVSSLTASQVEPRPLYRLRTFYVLPAVNAYASFTATDVYVPWVEGASFLRLCTCIVPKGKGCRSVHSPHACILISEQEKVHGYVVEVYRESVRPDQNR